jgi:hypothetical protein
MHHIIKSYIAKGVGIGDIPQGGLGRLLVRGEKNWDIIDDKSKSR